MHKQQEHSETVNSAKATVWSGIGIRIFQRLIRIRLDVCRIGPRMWVYSLVGVRHFAKYRKKSADDCTRNANESPKSPYSAMVKKMKKWSDQHQKLNTSRRSPLAHASHVWSMSVSRFTSSSTSQLICHHPHSRHPSLFHSRLKTYLFNKSFPP